MASIGAGWVDGAFIQAGWVTAGNGAWAQTSAAATDPEDGLILAGMYIADKDFAEPYLLPANNPSYPVKKYE